MVTRSTAIQPRLKVHYSTLQRYIEYTGRSRLGKSTSHGEARSREETLVCASKTTALCEVGGPAMRDCFKNEKRSLAAAEMGPDGPLISNRGYERHLRYIRPQV